jgi:hypothetical protein
MLDKISIVTTAANEQLVADGRTPDLFKTMAEHRYDPNTFKNYLDNLRERLRSGKHSGGKAYYFTFDRREFTQKHLGTKLGGFYKAVDDQTTDAIA